MDEDNKGGANHDNKNQFKSEEEMTPEELKEQKEVEDFILGFDEEDLSDPDKAKELAEKLKNAKTTIHQKTHYRTKVGELTTALEKAKKPEEKKPAPAAAAATTDADKEAENKRIGIMELRQEGFNKEQATQIYDAAKQAGMSVEDALKSPVFAPFIEKLKTKDEVEDASFAPQKRTGSAPNSDKIDWSKATPEEVTKQRQKVQGHR